MARVTVNETYLSDIADAIRNKLDTEDTYKPSEMAEAIETISGGGSEPIINPLSVATNGTYTAPTGVDGYSPVTVNVPSSATLGTKSITQNGTYNASSDSLDGYSSVTVNVSGGSSLSLQLELIGTYEATLEEWTNTSSDNLIETDIMINSSVPYAYIIATVECDGTLDTSNANNWGGIAIGIGGRYGSSNSYKFISCGTINAKGAERPINISEMTSNAFGASSYGVYFANNTGHIVVKRRAHATAFPKIMGGKYTIKCYGITAI